MRRAAAELAYLDDLIKEITTDATGADEQLWAFRQAFEDDVTERRGLIARCRGADGRKRAAAASDVVIPLEEQAGLPGLGWLRKKIVSRPPCGGTILA